MSKAHTVAVVVAVLSAACAPAVDRAPAIADDVDDVNVDVGFISGIICNRHTGAVIDSFTLTLTDTAGVSTVEEITTADNGAFKVEATPGLTIVGVADVGYLKTWTADVVGGETFILEDGTACR